MSWVHNDGDGGPRPGRGGCDDRRYVAAIDQGTTSSRCIVFDHRGRLVSVGQREHQQHFPRRAGSSTTRRRSGATSSSVVAQALPGPALGVARPGRDRHHQPARDHGAVGPRHRRPDRAARSTGRTPAPTRWCEELAGDGGRRPVPRPLRAAAGHLLRRPEDPLAAGPRRGLRERAERGEVLFGTMETWLIWNLTGGRHVTDVTNASRTMLMDIDTLDWDDDLLAAIGVPRAMLPEIRSSAEVYGEAPRRARRRARRGRARRPAGGAVRPDLLRPRRGQVHVRDRQLPAAQHRRRAGAVGARAAHHGRLQDRRRARRRTRWRARSRSPARWCSGSATTSG